MPLRGATPGRHLRAMATPAQHIAVTRAAEGWRPPDRAYKVQHPRRGAEHNP